MVDTPGQVGCGADLKPLHVAQEILQRAPQGSTTSARPMVSALFHPLFCRSRRSLAANRSFKILENAFESVAAPHPVKCVHKPKICSRMGEWGTQKRGPASFDGKQKAVVRFAVLQVGPTLVDEASSFILRTARCCVLPEEFITRIGLEQQKTPPSHQQRNWALQNKVTMIMFRRL